MDTGVFCTTSSYLGRIHIMYTQEWLPMEGRGVRKGGRAFYFFITFHYLQRWKEGTKRMWMMCVWGFSRVANFVGCII